MKWTFCLLNLFALLMSSLNAEDFVYRHSADFTEQIVYLANDYAILKSIRAGEDGEATTYFEIVKARWVQEPELASYTGDKIEETLINNPLRIGLSNDRQWLVGTSKKFDWKKKDEMPFAFAVDLSSGTKHEGPSIKKLSEQLHIPLAQVQVESVHAFFDRNKLTSLKMQNQKQKSTTNNQ
jgi:hypothetical protein